MNQQLLNLSLIAFSILFINWFKWYVKKKYGMQPSFSASAKPLQKDGKVFYFYCFIVLGTCFPLAYVANSWLTTIGSSLLALIGVLTGYNPSLVWSNKEKDIKWQNIVHIVAVETAILLFLIEMSRVNLLYLILIGIAAIPCLIIFFKKVKNHTWYIEDILYYLIWVWLILEKVILL